MKDKDEVSASAVGHPDLADAEPIKWSAVIINYNGGEQILRTIASLRDTVVAPAEIIIVDDGSSDASLDSVRTKFPDVRIIELGRNTGRTSIVRNAGLSASSHRYVLVTDNDIIFLKESVLRMLEVLIKIPDAGACTPIVMFADNANEIFSHGHEMHFLCWSAASEGESIEELQKRGPVPATGCGIQLIDCERIGHIGGFDEKLVIGWGDDGDFHHRLRIAGLACYAVPSARVLHARVRNTPRVYGQIHNRLIILIKCYELRTLIVLLPVLVAFEMALAVYLAIIGRGRDYLRAVADVWRLRSEILRDRRRIQRLRRCPDRLLLVAGPLALPGRGEAKVDGSVTRVGRVLELYWRAVQPLLRSKTA